MRPWVDALADHGVRTLAVDLPKSSPQRAGEVFRVALSENPGAAMGGHSYGGRIASLVAAESPVSALVLLSYPLHRPGHPDDRRTAHWGQISCPVLLLSGERDPFARIDLLAHDVSRLARAELVTYPNQGHGLLSELDDAASRIARFLSKVPQ